MEGLLFVYSLALLIVGGFYIWLKTPKGKEWLKHL